MGGPCASRHHNTIYFYFCKHPVTGFQDIVAQSIFVLFIRETSFRGGGSVRHDLH